ncbi:MAG: hypothetical protein R6V39_11650, partial [Desulfovibrionales bacterium]
PTGPPVGRAQPNSSSFSGIGSPPSRYHQKYLLKRLKKNVKVNRKKSNKAKKECVQHFFTEIC